MPQPASKEQVEAWVKAGMITRAQGDALLASPAVVAPAPTSVAAPTRRLDLGPAPAWRDLRAPAAGLGLALLGAALLLVLDLVASRFVTPGLVMRWVGFALVVALLAWTLLARDRHVATALLASVTLAALRPWLDPSAPTASSAFALVVVVAAHALALPPASRVVLACVGLPTALTLLSWLFDGSLVALAGGVLGYILLLWFTLPHESGWRRIPLVVALSLGATPLVVGLMLAATGSVSVRDGDSSFGGFTGVLEAGGLLLALFLYPLAIYRLWSLPTAQAFHLKGPVPVPRLARQT